MGRSDDTPNVVGWVAIKIFFSQFLGQESWFQFFPSLGQGFLTTFGRTFNRMNYPSKSAVIEFYHLADGFVRDVIRYCPAFHGLVVIPNSLRRLLALITCISGTSVLGYPGSNSFACEKAQKLVSCFFVFIFEFLWCSPLEFYQSHPPGSVPFSYQARFLE